MSEYAGVPIRPNDLRAACLAAMALTDVEDENCRIQMRHAAGALVLHELARRILSGEVIVKRNPELDPPAPPPPPEGEPLDIE